MYRSFQVKSFRCFSDVTTRDLARINLIAGLNNVGKTALLEALFLHCGAYAPALTLRVSGLRGFSFPKIEIPGLSDFPWDSLFAGFATGNVVELTGENGDGAKRVLRLRVVDDPAELGTLGESVPPELGGTDLARALSAHPPVLALEYSEDNGKSGKSYLLLGKKSFRQIPIPPPPPFPAIFLPARARTVPAVDAERFGRMEVLGQQDIVRDALKVIEPRLQRLAVVVVGDTPVIHGDIGLGRLVPLLVMGDGMMRLLSLVVGIGNAPKGVVLVDEIENGLHHTVLRKVWRAIAEAARQFDVQVFATTHSFECIAAAHRAFDEDLGFQYDFRLHRLERVNGNIVARTCDRDALRAALEMGLEVR